MSMTVLMDLTIIVLLVAVIYYASKLNKNLMILRDSKNDMGKQIEAFNDATNRAERALPKLKKLAEDINLDLKTQMEKAQIIRDDLAFMLERADGIIDSVDSRPKSNIKQDKKAKEEKTESKINDETVVKPKTMLGALAMGADDFDGDERSEAEKELLRALRNVK